MWLLQITSNGIKLPVTTAVMLSGEIVSGKRNDDGSCLERGGNSPSASSERFDLRLIRQRRDHGARSGPWPRPVPHRRSAA